MPPDQDVRAKQELLEALLKEYRIEFVRSSDDETRADLRAEFEFTAKIEHLDYDSYGQSNHETDPAIVENNLQRARNLKLKVDECAEFDDNEKQWRWGVENTLFEVFRKPMICSTCNKRLWRAGIEFPIDLTLENDEIVENLKKRRDKRAICCCLVPRFQSEMPAPAHIFDLRLDKRVQYEPNFRKRVMKGKHPDLIVGLANSHKFKKVLNAPLEIQGQVNEDKTVRSVLKTNLFANTSGMIFPFLVLEAKQGRAPESQRDIERQMAPPAYEMLRMQTSLLEKSTLVGRSNRLPRVWLISSKAEDWKVYIGTVVPARDHGYAYKIHRLWAGDISMETGALRLILLLDGILDWARDIYRMDVFDHLSSMAPIHDSNDPLNRPTMTPVAEVFERLSVAPSISPSMPAIPETPSCVRKYRSGWVIDGRRLTRTGGGLRINEDNIDNLFEILEQRGQAQQFARWLWNYLSGGSVYCLNDSPIDVLRNNWMEQEYVEGSRSVGPVYIRWRQTWCLCAHLGQYEKLRFVCITEGCINQVYERARFTSRDSQRLSDVKDNRKYILPKTLNLFIKIAILAKLPQVALSLPKPMQTNCENIFSDEAPLPSLCACFRCIPKTSENIKFNGFNDCIESWQRAEIKRLFHEHEYILDMKDLCKLRHGEMEPTPPPLCLLLNEDISQLSGSAIEEYLSRAFRNGKTFNAIYQRDCLWPRVEYMIEHIRDPGARGITEFLVSSWQRELNPSLHLPYPATLFHPNDGTRPPSASFITAPHFASSTAERGLLPPLPPYRPNLAALPSALRSPLRPVPCSSNHTWSPLTPLRPGHLPLSPPRYLPNCDASYPPERPTSSPSYSLPDNDQEMMSDDTSDFGSSSTDSEIS